MGKIAYIFPGQASQYVGMARDIHDNSDRVSDLFAAASSILGFDLSDVCFNGPLEILTRTEHTQPAVLVHSLALLRLLSEYDLRPDFCAGHSLGEYSALACAGAMSFEDAITAVRERSRLMKEACDSTDGTMTAAIGGDDEAIAGLIEAARDHGILQAANYNSPGQVVLSGDRRAAEFAQENYREFGFKRMLPLKVGGAFHSPLMGSAGVRMSAALDKIEIRDADIPVYANVTAMPTRKAAEIKRLLVEQITSPVKWTQTIENMREAGVESFVEIGPGSVLAGLVKKIVPDAVIQNVDTLADLEEFVKVGAPGC